ncbi:hypothetical protein BDP81DRAFT_91541 [Colletotrichum phormii]|uniref:Uncharacterized protein n=1 Tax=Colletotrichum phormii TaxID=359342 RepID=A0AAJ0A5H6_9PEZI|nr:uncharacterized protein BDP81DRAFT_91541 [Colletotrichum phormii]KAK1654955.1 hypothetical protein BDP81DRAFT_91541 [Colletotrichum phormii]
MGFGIAPRLKQNIGLPADRRGIDSQGEYSDIKQSFFVQARRRITSLFCCRSNDDGREASEKFSANPYTSHDIKGGYRHHQPLATPSNEQSRLNGETIWQLSPGSNIEQSWNRLEKTIDAFIAVTPVDEYQFTPRIVVEPCEIGQERKKARPTVLISCSSHPYGKKMAETLQRSGVLETHSATFSVMVRP